MIRYLRLYAYFVRFSFSRAMEFRLDFWFRIVMDSIWYAVQIAFFMVLFQHTQMLGGWNFDQILIFTAAFMFIDALDMTMFSNNFWWLPIFINKGDLDYYLTRPVSSLFFLMLRDFAANSFVNLLIAGGILATAIIRYPGYLGAVNIALFIGLLFLGSAFYAYVKMLFLIPTFWLHSTSGLRDVMFHVQKAMERPDQIYAGWLRRVLTTVLPLALISSWPTHVLFEGLTAWRAGWTAAVFAGSFFILVRFWNLGLRSYSSASS